MDRYFFFGGAALLFVAALLATIHGCISMAAMKSMPMPGGWAMSMAWMRMPGQGWVESAAAFLGMWIAMMVAMMLPVLTPMLWRYRRALDERRRGHLIALAGLGYFFVWTLFGALLYPVGIALATLLMRQPLLAQFAPVAAGVIVLGAGLLQFTAWKARLLACCRMAPVGLLHANAIAAWRHGLRLGVHCVCCCAGATAVLLVVGVMDWRAMLVVTLAIAAERLAPAGERVAGIIGVVVAASGVALSISAAGLG